MNDLNALETPYDGHLFRSRREARWAVFFNTARIPWEYEEQGFDLGKAGWYLPDFRINAGTPSELFFEVKGKRPAREELAMKYPEFRHATRRLQAAYDAARAARFDARGAAA